MKIAKENIKTRTLNKSLGALSDGIAVNTIAFVHLDITPKSIISEGKENMDDEEVIEIVSKNLIRVKIERFHCI